MGFPRQKYWLLLSHFSHVQLFGLQPTRLLSKGFSRQEYWSQPPLPPLGGLSGPGIEPVSLTSPALADGFFTTSATWDGLPFPKNYLTQNVNSVETQKFWSSISTSSHTFHGSRTQVGTYIHKGIYWRITFNSKKGEANLTTENKVKKVA